MAVVRCPIHKIPYNDENPRGCPACAQEKTGGTTEVMRELARASQLGKRGSTVTGFTIAEPERTGERPVTTQPRIPLPGVTRLALLLKNMRRRREILIAAGALAVLIIFFTFNQRTRFTRSDNPPAFSGAIYPLPVAPNDPVAMVFSALGAQESRPNPSTPSVERYAYGDEVQVDALNGSVYALTLSSPNRSWRGLRVGMTPTGAEGMLALLGPPRDVDAPASSRPDTVSGYVVYRSLELRPRRTLLAEVRPPNNCFDVLVDIQPRVIGVLSRGGEILQAVSDGGPEDWVVTRIRAISRSVPGPYAAKTAC